MLKGKLPNIIKLGAFYYTVEVVPQSVFMSEGDDRSNLWGEISCSKLVIRVRDDLAEQQRFQTLLHEVVHGILRNAGMSADEDHNERIIDAIAHGFMAFLLENPGLLVDVDPLSLVETKKE